MSTFQSNKVQVLNKLLMVGLQVSIWSARKKLREEDLGDDLTLPPSILASLGSKRTIDPERIKPFERLKRRATRLLEERGTRFMGAYAIPETIAGEVAAELEDIEREFNAEKATFLASYDLFCNEWVNRPWEKPEWREAIMRAITPKGVVESRLNYRFSLCRVLPDESNPVLVKGLEREVQGLSGQLFREIADEAEDISENTLKGTASVTQKTVNRIWKMHAKLTSLAFLSPEVQGLADFLAKQLLALPKTGKLEGADFQNLFSLVLNLSDESKMASLVGLYGGSLVLDIVADEEELPADAPAAEFVAEPGSAVEELFEVELVNDIASVIPPAAIDLIEKEIEMAQAVIDSVPSETVVEAEPEMSVVIELAPDEGEGNVIDFCM